MYDDNNDIKKRQVEVLKEGLELQNDVNEFAKEINKGISDINNALFGNNIVQMRECAISIKRKYPLFYVPPQSILFHYLILFFSCAFVCINKPNIQTASHSIGCSPTSSPYTPTPQRDISPLAVPSSD